jgi:hypothetical protein
MSLSNDANSPTSNTPPPLPLRAFATYRIFVSTLNFVCMFIVDIAIKTLLPVILTTSLSQGGMGYTSHTTGLGLAFMGTMNALTQLFLFPRLHGYMGGRNLCILAASLSLPMFALCPISHLLAKEFGQFHPSVVAALVMLFMLVGLMNMAFDKSHRRSYTSIPSYFCRNARRIYLGRVTGFSINGYNEWDMSSCDLRRSGHRTNSGWFITLLYGGNRGSTGDASVLHSPRGRVRRGLRGNAAPEKDVGEE